MHCPNLEKGHVLTDKHIKRAFDWELNIFNQGMANSLSVSSVTCNPPFPGLIVNRSYPFSDSS